MLLVYLYIFIFCLAGFYSHYSRPISVILSGWGRGIFNLSIAIINQLHNLGVF